ncbi:MAG TPA: ferredoxin [Methanoregulaceae archaeon]|jgi:ferredoxin|nr:ferredoxin [Burkholderiaceae bacterium]NLH26231.1 ferredoxin [Methanomicrobiales archaeon]HPS22013.1 ferredoxin [Methanoregulaceae archaeon]
MKVIIDRLNCVSCGTCWEICPDFFEENPDDSFSQVIERFRIEGNNAGGIPPIELEACTVDAADLCPASVISIEE